MVIHLIGEQGHEERKTSGVSRAGLSTVEGLEGITSSELKLGFKTMALFPLCSFLSTRLDAYMEQALHQLLLPLLTFRAALCQLDDHSHVTCSQDGLQTLEQLIKQLLELQGVRDSQKGVLMRPSRPSSRGQQGAVSPTSLYLAEAAVSL